MYTVKQWHADGTLKAVDGEQIEREIYFTLRDALPPVKPGKEAVQKAGRTCGVIPADAFMLGEPERSGPSGFIYRLFIEDKEGRTYYAGLYER